MPKVKSKRQWRNFGHLLSAGKISKAEFDARVHGVRYAGLPEAVEMAKKRHGMMKANKRRTR